MLRFPPPLLGAPLLALAGCGDTARLPLGDSYGPRSQLPEPNRTLIPTVHIAKAVGWPPGRTPRAAKACLDLAFYQADLLPARYRNGAFIGQHGSWNRRPRSGYKVIFVPFDDQGRPAGPPEDVLAGFVDDEKGEAYGRPVGVEVDKAGALLVADDVGDTVWRITPAR